MDQNWSNLRSRYAFIPPMLDLSESQICILAFRVRKGQIYWLLIMFELHFKLCNITLVGNQSARDI